ncbi:MAG: hypothetical protein IK095_10050 [Oscillospiraceae bacterium]|nr:hypothetical protein [Oscillospiraceae bacterium]
MHFPKLRPTAQRRLVTERFLGYDHRPEPGEGAFYDMEGLGPQRWPELATRPRRGLVRRLTQPGGILAKDALITVEDGTLCVSGHPTALTGLASGPKQLVSMGALVLVFPDKLWIDTADLSRFGSLEAELLYEGAVEYALCDREGALLGEPTVSAAEPGDPVNGQLWLDSSGGGRRLLRWSESLMSWTEETAVYTRLRLSSMGDVPRLFKALDGIRVEGTAFPEDLDGEKIVWALGGGQEERDWLVLTGLIGAGLTREGERIRLSRKIPDFDYVCECQNRLWGCRYGLRDGENVNEIWASALGDPRNFRQFLGLATDSWTASVGSDGPWTGAASYMGHPCFFKEERIHTVTVSATGAHRLEETAARGPQRGAAGSLCLVGETLFYKSRDGACAWQGGFPRQIGQALGELRCTAATAGSVDGRWYLSLESEGTWTLYVYDPALGQWYRDGALHALGFAALDGELYALDADTGDLLALKGGAGTPEAELRWMAETGPLRCVWPDRQYLSRLDLDLWAQAGSRAEVWLRYDDEGDWERAALLERRGSGSVSLPIRPRRCDRLRLRLKGRGEIRLRAIGQVLERGSDLGP